MDITTKLRLDHDDGEHMSGPVAGCSACCLILSFTRVPTNAYVIATTGKEIWRGSQDQLVALVDDSVSLRPRLKAALAALSGILLDDPGIVCDDLECGDRICELVREVFPDPEGDTE